MGLINIGGSKKKSKNKTTASKKSTTTTKGNTRQTTNQINRTKSTSNTNTSQSSQSSTFGTSNANQNFSSISETTALTPDILKKLEASIADQFSRQGEGSDLLEALVQGSLARAERGQAQIDDIIAAAELEGGNQVQQQQAAFQRQAGSRLNTGVLELSNRAANDLQVALAGQRGELELENTDAGLEALNRAVTATQNQRTTETAALAPLLGVLAQATQRTSNKGSSNTNTTNRSNTSGSQTSTSRTNQNNVSTSKTNQNTRVNQTTNENSLAKSKTKGKAGGGSFGISL